MTLQRWAAILGAACCLAAASDPAERLADPAQEAHARALFGEIRCLVCQGESIDESDVPLAADLRRVVRQKVSAGLSDGQIRGFLRQRYGDFVLFRPSLDGINALLWASPFLVVLMGLGWLVGRARAPAYSEPPLTPEEAAREASLKADDCA